VFATDLPRGDLHTPPEEIIGHGQATFERDIAHLDRTWQAMDEGVIAALLVFEHLHFNLESADLGEHGLRVAFDLDIEPSRWMNLGYHL
jgi:hypothetical protein